MRPGTYDLLMYRGDTYGWEFHVWLDEGKTQPADLTGVTAKAEVRTAPGGTVLGTLPCVVTTPNKVAMSMTNWATWTARQAVWDLQLTYPDTSVLTILAGQVVVTPDVTDSTPLGLVARRREAAASHQGALT